MRRLIPAAVLVATWGIGGFAQSVVVPAPAQIQAPQATPTPVPVKGNGVVMGQVVDARGNGVPAAVVTLQGGWQAIALTTVNRDVPGGPRSTLTSRDGHFAFFDLTPGTYAFDANKPGFIAGAYGRVRPGGAPQSINLKDNDRLTTIRIPIWEYAAVTGTVRDETGEAVVGMQVRALRRQFINGRWQWTAGSQAQTNDRGEYRIDTLVPGQYVVVAASTQTSMPAEAAAGVMSRTIEAQMELMRMGLSPSAATSGRQVGNVLWSSTRSAMALPDPSNDGRVLVYPTTFFPSARSIRTAEAMTLESGQERRGADLQLALTASTMVSGTFMGLDGPLAGQSIRLMPEYLEDLSGDMFGLETAVAVSDSNGRFAFVGVPAGQYVVQAEMGYPTGPSAKPSASSGGWLNDRLTVPDSGVSNVTFTLRRPVKVSGQLVFDGTKPHPAPELIPRFSVSLEPQGFAVNRNEAAYQAYFDANGQFVFPAVPPGQYIITFRAAIADRRAMPDWETKGATLGGRDVTDHLLTISEDVSGIQIVLTDHNSELNGTVRDAAGKVDPSAAILMFTAERELWPFRMTRRIRSFRASETGTYTVRGVPAGEYFLIAIPDVDIGDFPDIRMLEALSKNATRFTMAPSEHKTQDLVVKAVR